MCIVKFTLSKYNSKDDSEIVKTINEKLCSFQFRRIISLTVDSQDSWFEIVIDNYNIDDDIIQSLIAYLSLRFQSHDIEFHVKKKQQQRWAFPKIQKNELIYSL